MKKQQVLKLGNKTMDLWVFQIEISVNVLKLQVLKELLWSYVVYLFVCGTTKQNGEGETRCRKYIKESC